MRRTPDEIRKAGLKALRDRLGRAGMIRFMQQFENGRGDYAKSRRTWADKTNLSDISRAATKTKSSSDRRSRKDAA